MNGAVKTRATKKPAQKRAPSPAGKMPVRPMQTATASAKKRDTIELSIRSPGTGDK